MCEKSAEAAAAGLSNSESDIIDLRSQVQSSQGQKKPVPKCYPKWRGKPVYDGNKEALGWTLLNIAMSIQYVGAGAFLATTILRVAEGVSNCHTENADTDVDLNELCGPAITSFKPSSLLTLYAMVVGFIAACILPFIGAIIDFTSHRLLIGRIMAGIYTLVLLPLMFLTEQNYIIILVCHGFSVFFGWFVTTLQYAYLPELTTDELQLADWNKYITMWTFLSMLIYLAGVIVGVVLLKKARDDIFTSRVAMGVIFVINATFLQFSWWFLFEKREPLHEKPENSSLCTVGFKQLYSTGRHIVRNYRSLKWYFLSIAFANSGWQAFGIMFLTYISNFLDFNALQSGIAISSLFIGSIPGAIVGTFVARRLDPIKSYRINLVLMIICVTVFVTILNAPGQQKRTYIYSTFIGFNGGWKTTMDRLISSSIIPLGQDTEMMGLFLFSDQCLLWLPLMVYVIMNEAGISPRINVAILNVYLFISLFFLCMTGSYVTARAEVNRASIYLKNGEKNAAIATAKANTDVAVVEDTAEGTKDCVDDQQSPPTAQADKTIMEA